MVVNENEVKFELLPRYVIFIRVFCRIYSVMTLDGCANKCLNVEDG